MKTYLKRGLTLILSLLVLFFSLVYLSYLLKIKRSDGPLSMQSLYAQKKNTCDVLLLGSSHVGMNLDTEELWHSFGIPAYNLWGSIQPFWNSYYTLQEALKAQRPKVVVLDVFSAIMQSEYQDPARQETNLVGMHHNMNRIRATKVSAPPERHMNLFLEFPLYHTRIRELTGDDFAHFPWTKGLINYKGSFVHYGSSGGTMPITEPTGQVTPLPAKQEEYLLKIIRLCQEEALPLVLIKTPYNGWNDEQGFYNRVGQIAQEHNIPFIDFNTLWNSLGMNDSDIWVDQLHINTQGGRKLSHWLGSFLFENYGLTDRRDDPDYASWQLYSQQQRTDYLKSITNTADYLNELCRYDYALLAIKQGSWQGDADSLADFYSLCRSFGLGTDFFAKEGCAHVLVPSAKKPEPVEHSLDEQLFCQYDFEGSQFTLQFTDILTLTHNNAAVVQKACDPLVLAVYDPATRSLLDAVEISPTAPFAVNHL